MCCKGWKGYVLSDAYLKDKAWLSFLFTLGMQHERLHGSQWSASQMFACPTYCTTGLFPAISIQKVCLGKCLRSWSLLIPSHRASNIQFPSMWQLIPPPYTLSLTLSLTHIHAARAYIHTQSIMLTLHTDAVCKQSPVDSKIQLCTLPSPSRAVC